eukprot:1426017-Pyramimonas_sp.AAC.1
MGSYCFEHFLEQPKGLTGYPSSPHRPVVMDMVVEAPCLIPVLEQTQCIPAVAPAGPRNTCPPWSRSSGALEFLEDILEDRDRYVVSGDSGPPVPVQP